jgi:hypothetical protein
MNSNVVAGIQFARGAASRAGSGSCDVAGLFASAYMGKDYGGRADEFISALKSEDPTTKAAMSDVPDK